MCAAARALARMSSLVINDVEYAPVKARPASTSFTSFSCSSYHHHFLLVVLFSAHSASHLSRTVLSSCLPQTRAKAVALIAPCLAHAPFDGGRKMRLLLYMRLLLHSRSSRNMRSLLYMRLLLYSSRNMIVRCLATLAARFCIS